MDEETSVIVTEDEDGMEDADESNTEDEETDDSPTVPEETDVPHLGDKEDHGERKE